MNKYTQEDLDKITYFHVAKGDITRYVDWDIIKESVFKDFPELKKALEDFENSEKTLDLVIESLEYKYD